MFLWFKRKRWIARSTISGQVVKSAHSIKELNEKLTDRQRENVVFERNRRKS